MNILRNARITARAENYAAFVFDFAEHTVPQPLSPLKLEATGSASAAFLRKETIALPYYPKLLTQYKLKEIAGGGSVFDRALRIMSWLTENTQYCGMSMHRLRDNGAEILQWSAGRGFCHAINCRNKAFALADCLLALGISALPLMFIGGIRYKGKPGMGCHVMVHVYLPELGKWALLDPSANAWFGAENHPSDVVELREMLANEQFPKINGFTFMAGTAACLEAYKLCFLRPMQYIFAWESNSSGRMKATDRLQHYVLATQGESFMEFITKLYGKRSARKYNVLPIGAAELLSAK
ncbi:MAG: transglutaminase-like domain-containing protein [Oscillospiraceae bacterium]|nr:transglutaminase-like domain-containing protein [Oscillospiraceae bacterium]